MRVVVDFVAAYSCFEVAGESKSERPVKVGSSEQSRSSCRHVEVETKSFLKNVVDPQGKLMVNWLVCKECYDVYRPRVVDLVLQVLRE